MKLTAKLKLLPTQEQAVLLRETQERCNQACTWISEQAWNTGTFEQYPLHKLVYREVRERFALSAQATVRAIAKVADAYKLDHKKVRTFRQEGAVAYDRRLLSYNLPPRTVSIWTLTGRICVPFVCGSYHEALLQTQKGESDLCLANGEFYLLATCERAEWPVRVPANVLGVDLGLAQLATDSDGVFYGGHVRAKRRRRNQTRQSLQRKGSQSAKRKLKRRSKKERRFAQDVNHCISKQLVAKAQRTNRAIALEDLQGIRWRARAGRELRRELHSWAFYDLRQKIAYKAQLAGVPVYTVNAAYTSQTCHLCGHRERKNRRSQSEFSCRKCGAQCHADVNAAINIASRGAVHLPHGVQWKLF